MSRPSDSATGTHEYPFLTESIKRNIQKGICLQQGLSAKNSDKNRAFKNVLG
jgi:hypothetical protein